MSSKVAKRLKIGIVFDDTLDRPDGVQQCILLLGDWLRSQGHDVHYLVGQTSRTDVPNVYSLSRTAKVSFNGNTLAIPLPASRAKIAHILKDLRLDVLHVQIPYSPFMAGRVISASTSEALVGTFHILPYGRAAVAGTKILGSIQRKNLARFSGVTATSGPAAAFAHTAYGLSAVTVPNPVDVARFHVKPASQARSSKHRIVFLGRLVPRKGALQLLQAVAELVRRGVEDVEVRIGGNGTQMQELKRYVESNGLSRFVAFDGFIAEANKAEYLALADIAVFPAMAGESFGIVLIEAMAAKSGVVVGGDNPGYRSVLSPWPECLVDAFDAATFADALQKLLSDTPLREKIHKQQQDAVKQYDISRVGADFVRVYTEAILHHTTKVQ